MEKYSYFESYQNSGFFNQKPRDTVDYSQPFSDIEKDLLQKCNVRTEADVHAFADEVERARARWACISSKTQRSFGASFDLQVYEDVTKLKYHFEGIEGTKPPDRTGEVVSGFSKKSRSRMLDKMRMMKKKDLQLPFFVTLTYQKNMMDFEKAKNDLNTFFQRLRRIDREAYYIINPDTGRKNKKWKRLDDFKYAWKMEPQERGAIHFHLMLFMPEKIYPKKWKDSDSKRLQFLQMRIGAMWNEISDQSTDFEPVRSSNGKYYGNMSLLAGTNVRAVDNWNMATGYLGKYMKKEVEGEKWKDEPTGRFWGFSNNFDFSCYYRQQYDLKEIQQIRESLYQAVHVSYHQYLQREKANLERIENSDLHTNKKTYKKEKILKRIKKQKRRAVINLEKIERGAMVQIEISQLLSEECFP